MKTFFSIALVVVVAAFPAVQSQTAGKAKQSQPAAKSKAKDTNFYPLEVGSKWEYDLVAGPGQKGTFSSTIAGVENTDGKSLSRLEVAVNGQKAAATEHLMSNKDRVFRAKMNGMVIDPPLCILKYPIKDKQTWETKTSAAGQQLKVTCRQTAEEEIQVPAGKYRTIPCTIETMQGEVKIVNTYWFAEDVGVVKQKIEIGPRVITMELTKYQAAK